MFVNLFLKPKYGYTRFQKRFGKIMNNPINAFYRGQNVVINNVDADGDTIIVTFLDPNGNLKVEREKIDWSGNYILATSVVF